MNEATTKPLRYMRQLDGVRAIAVGLVLLHHWANLASPLINGRVGVITFFILSGFLITSILLEARDGAEQRGVGRLHVIRNFYIRRFLRIFPLFYLTLIVTYIIGVPDIRKYIGWHAFYLSNVIISINHSWLGASTPFWSLAIEEQFYLCWPALMLFVPRRLLLWVIAACIGIAPLSRILLYLAGVNEYAIWVLPFCLLDALCLGALLAYLRRYKLPQWFQLRPWLYVASAAGLLLFCGLYAYLQSTGWNDTIWTLYSDSLIALSMFGLVIAAAEGAGGWLGALLSTSVLVYLGRISYGLYLVHGFIPGIFYGLVTRFRLPYAADPLVLNVAVWFIVTVMLCSLSWYLYENRINGLKRFFPYLPKV